MVLHSRYLIVVPTYDERENIGRLVDAVAAMRETAPPGGEVLVVDDSSPDGTGAEAERLAAEHAWLHVLHRPEKQGLGAAYLDGFRWALERGYDLILEMDCDLSHPVEAVPRLLAAASDADLVLGSRYVDGGRVVGWPLHRRLISRFGCLYARTILGVPVADLTGGFKCFRRSLLRSLDLTGIAAEGYAFQIELTYRALRAGARVVEVPIAFTDRTDGRSKMTHAIVAEAVWQVPALRARAAAGRLEPRPPERAEALVP